MLILFLTFVYMWSNLQKYKLILASQSPRRVELLSGLDINFEQKVLQGIDESYPENLSADEVPEHIVRKKAEGYRSLVEAETLLIVADTLVLLEDKILGKPKDREEAISMLRNLSGKKHRVITAVGLISQKQEVFFSDTTEVFFAPMTDETINYYIKHYKPYDKAGAYGIQEWIGYHSIERIEGSYFNVMGLPLQKMSKYLKEF